MSPRSPDDEYLQIERWISAPRALVYQAFTDPSRMMQWFGPRGFTATTVELDVRPGGAWRAGMRGLDGKELVASGVYREVVPNERLVFTYAWEEGAGRGHETECQLQLADENGQTRMTFRQGPFEAKGDREGHAGGWSSAFEKLAEALER
jgi:uncharacterized protein YndB with AHSA1/START domain